MQLWEFTEELRDARDLECSGGSSHTLPHPTPVNIVGQSPSSMKGSQLCPVGHQQVGFFFTLLCVNCKGSFGVLVITFQSYLEKVPGNWPLNGVHPDGREIFGFCPTLYSLHRMS